MLDKAGILFGDHRIYPKHLNQKTGQSLVAEIDLGSLESPLLGQVDIPVGLLTDIPILGKHFHGPVYTRLGDAKTQGNIGGADFFMFLTECQNGLKIIFPRLLHALMVACIF